MVNSISYLHYHYGMIFLLSKYKVLHCLVSSDALLLHLITLHSFIALHPLHYITNKLHRTITSKNILNLITLHYFKYNIDIDVTTCNVTYVEENASHNITCVTLRYSTFGWNHITSFLKSVDQSAFTLFGEDDVMMCDVMPRNVK